jgi:hypothetical protein
MAAFQGIAQIAEEALGAATEETLIQLVAASNHRVKVLGWGIFFDGTSVTAEPVQVKLSRQTTAGTASSLSLVKRDDSIAETLQTSAQQDFTAEPTEGDVLESREVHPQAGFEVWYPLGQEIIIGGGDRLGLIATAPAAVNARAFIVFEE